MPDAIMLEEMLLANVGWTCEGRVEEISKTILRILKQRMIYLFRNMLKYSKMCRNGIMQILGQKVNIVMNTNCSPGEFDFS